MQDLVVHVRSFDLILARNNLITLHTLMICVNDFFVCILCLLEQYRGFEIPTKHFVFYN